MYIYLLCPNPFSGIQDRTFVHDIVPGFAAYQSTRFLPGDELISVDGRRVKGLDLEYIKRLTVGLEYTLCSLEMVMPGSAGLFLEPFFDSCAIIECGMVNLVRLPN